MSNQLPGQTYLKLTTYLRARRPQSTIQLKPRGLLYLPDIDLTQGQDVCLPHHDEWSFSSWPVIKEAE